MESKTSTQCPHCHRTLAPSTLPGHIRHQHTHRHRHSCPHPACTKHYSTSRWLRAHVQKAHPGVLCPPARKWERSVKAKDLGNGVGMGEEGLETAGGASKSATNEGDEEEESVQLLEGKSVEELPTIMAVAKTFRSGTQKEEAPTLFNGPITMALQLRIYADMLRRSPERVDFERLGSLVDPEMNWESTETEATVASYENFCKRRGKALLGSKGAVEVGQFLSWVVGRWLKHVRDVHEMSTKDVRTEEVRNGMEKDIREGAEPVRGLLGTMLESVVYAFGEGECEKLRNVMLEEENESQGEQDVD